MLIRRERPGDAEAVRGLHLAAFAKRREGSTELVAGEVEARLVDDLRDDGDLVPECCLVAEAAEAAEAADAPPEAEATGRVVGHVAVSRATVDGVASVLALGPLGVDPEHQRRGVGTALMHAVIAAADALHAPAIVLLGHPDYYPRFGFAAAEDSGITPPQPWGREFFMLRRLEAWDGSLTGAFRYAPAFERLDG